MMADTSDFKIFMRNTISTNNYGKDNTDIQ